jgi:hypothetical protein
MSKKFQFEPRKMEGVEKWGWWSGAINPVDHSDVGHEVFDKLLEHLDWPDYQVRYYPTRNAAISALRAALSSYEAPSGWWWDIAKFPSDVRGTDYLPTALFNLLPKTRSHAGKWYGSPKEAKEALLDLVAPLWEESEPEPEPEPELELEAGYRYPGGDYFPTREAAIDARQKKLLASLEVGDIIRIPATGKKERCSIPEDQGEFFTVTTVAGEYRRCASQKTGNRWNYHEGPNRAVVMIREVTKADPETLPVTAEWLVTQGWEESFVGATRRLAASFLVWQISGLYAGSLDRKVKVPLPFKLETRGDLKNINETFNL